MAYSADDTQILRGIAALTCADEVATGINLEMIEQQLVADSPKVQRHEPIDDIMNDISAKFGIPVDDLVSAPGTATAPATRMTPQPTPAYIGGSTSPYARAAVSPYAAAYAPASTGAYSPPTMYDDAAPYAASPPAAAGVSAGVTATNAYGRTHFSDPNGGFSVSTGANGHEYMRELEEIEREDDEEQRADMIADIEQLLAALEADGVDITRYENMKPDSHASTREVGAYLRTLQKRMDRNRGSAIVDELLLFGVTLLEDIFDGKHEWFGYRPDLTGFSNTARTKMRRLRPESAVLASSVLQSHSLGPASRILLELAPAAFLHAHQRRQRHDERGLFDDATMADANTNIRKHE